MVSPQTSPYERAGGPPGAAAPSPAVTALLILLWFVLWLGVLWACLILLAQVSMSRELAWQLPGAVQWLFGLPWWKWFDSYWWLVVLGILVLTPAVGSMTYWVRHRLHSRLADWAWCTLLLVPPLLLLAVLVPSSVVANVGISQAIRAGSDAPENYLAADGQQLGSPLKLREIRQGVTGPEGEVVVIEPGGAWRVVPGPSEGERPPLRQGKLTTGQLAMLAEHLALVKFRSTCRVEEGVPAVPDPPPNRDLLVIEYGDHHLTLEGVRRQDLQQVQDLEPQDTELRSRFVSLALVIEDLVKPE
jgi:hypothetical protein